MLVELLDAARAQRRDERWLERVRELAELRCTSVLESLANE
jgi:hypothetical protein